MGRHLIVPTKSLLKTRHRCAGDCHDPITGTQSGLFGPLGDCDHVAGRGLGPSDPAGRWFGRQTVHPGQRLAGEQPHVCLGLGRRGRIHRRGAGGARCETDDGKTRPQPHAPPPHVASLTSIQLDPRLLFSGPGLIFRQDSDVARLPAHGMSLMPARHRRQSQRDDFLCTIPRSQCPAPRVAATAMGCRGSLPPRSPSERSSSEDHNNPAPSLDMAWRFRQIEDTPQQGGGHD
jgi:hypothetical protein